jgi:hypothetical protein
MMAFMADMSYSTALDDYVNTPDPHFSWKLLETYPSSTYTVYVLNMTSQQWMDGIMTAIKTIFINKIISCSLYRVILNTTDLVALYDYYSA